ncbi:mechanosensitive ion channel family protein [Tepidamorphus sp. 3E244]|uniref:mechanosensitive ion channel family protein n=1 Tax=Tepidamorphus sp. 3E244 TaxID=3385498 RepID=UPI0038FCA959
MDTDVEALMSNAMETASAILAAYAFSVIGALLILIFGLMAANWIQRWVRSALDRIEAVDPALASFLSKIVKYTIWVLVFVTVLSEFGVKTTSILAALGAAGLAVGLALQGTLANIAAGIMLLILRPFRVGEFIDADGIAGTIMDIGLFATEMKRVDGLYMMVPNSKLWGASVLNYSRNATRRLELIVGIDYGDDMGQAREILLEIAKSDQRVLDDPAPVSFVNSLDDSSVGIGLRCWLPASEYLVASWDITETAKRRFDEAGISIPFPQLDVNRKPDETEKEAA